MNGKKRWIRITCCQNIPLREGRSVRIAGREIAVFNLGARWMAIENLCPHKGGPLADGIVSGAAVVCPLHGWTVSLDAGKVLSPTSGSSARCLQTFPTRVDGGIVSIQLTVESAALTEESEVCTAQDGPLFGADEKHLQMQEAAVTDIGA